MNTHLQLVRKGAALLILLMGLAHLLSMPLLAWSSDRAALDFAGTGIAVILIGLINLTQAPAARGRRSGLMLPHVANGLYLAFLAASAARAPELPVLVALGLALVVWGSTVWQSWSRWRAAYW